MKVEISQGTKGMRNVIDGTEKGKDIAWRLEELKPAMEETLKVGVSQCQV